MNISQAAMLFLAIIAIAYLILKFGKALAAIIAIVAILLIGWGTLIFGFHGFSGQTRIATIQATPVQNQAHEMIVEMTTYDASGDKASDETYEIGGDRVFLQAEVVEFQPWVLMTGMKSAYQLQKIEGEYDGASANSTSISLGSWSWFSGLENNVGLLSPVIKSAYGNAVVIPNGGAYSVYADPQGDLSANRA